MRLVIESGQWQVGYRGQWRGYSITPLFTYDAGNGGDAVLIQSAITIDNRGIIGGGGGGGNTHFDDGGGGGGGTGGIAGDNLLNLGTPANRRRLNHRRYRWRFWTYRPVWRWRW